MTPNPESHCLRYAGKSFAAQKSALLEIVQGSSVLMQTLRTLNQMALNQGWIVSGAIYNQVWNHLTGRLEMYGVKDIDISYWDDDTSYEAEDFVIRQGNELFAVEPPIEIRNQARVPIWYREHFGHAYPEIKSAHEAIDNFACRTHCVGVKITDNGELELYAPFGLDDIFSFRLTPNPCLPNKKTHEAKGKRQLGLWPELTLVPWPIGQS